MAEIPNGLTRDQFVIALAEIDPAGTYRFLDDGSYEWRGPGDVPSDAAILAAWQAYADAQDAAATAAAEATATAAALPDHIQSLVDARDGLEVARTTMVTAVQNINAGDDVVQAWPNARTAAQLTDAFKVLSARNRAFVAAQVQADLAIEDGLHALYDAIQALKARG